MGSGSIYFLQFFFYNSLVFWNITLVFVYLLCLPAGFVQSAALVITHYCGWCILSGGGGGRVKRICVFEHSVMTNFNCACPAIQRGQGSGFLS